jgi:flagellar assembly protein FliH
MRGATVAPADMATVRSSAARDLVIAPELIEAAQREGFQAGYDAGWQAGYEDSMREIRQRNEDLTTRLQQVIRQLGEASEALHAREGTARVEIEDQVVASAFEIAQVLVGHELTHTESLGRAALARALQYAPADGHVVARLHPDDIVTLENPEQLVPGRQLTVVPDASLALGDCIVEVAACRIDARLAGAVQRVREVLGQA